MPSPVIGALAVVGISGLGRLIAKPLWRGTWPGLHVYLAAIMLTGMAAASAVIQIQAIAGTNAGALRATAFALLVVGVGGHLTPRPQVSSIARISWSKLNAAFALMLAVSLGCCIVATLAPSTKIDELHYHMLAGRYVLEDGGLRVYQQLELSMPPQMGYQIFESVFHAMGAPDAGNILSFSFALTLFFFVYGLVSELAHSATAGLTGAAVIFVGLYPVVWYVTSGPHALGDLAIVVAMACVLWPDRFSALGPKGSVLLASIASAVAASTKVSLVPIAILMTLCAFVLAEVSGRDLAIVAVQAASAWVLVLGPLVSWSWLRTGAPFGAAFAGFFGHSAYEPAVFASMEASRRVNQTGLLQAIIGAFRGYNAPLLILSCAGLILCLRRRRWLLLAALVFVQLVLIAKLLPHDVRFLGGLQYVAAIVAVISMAAGRSTTWWRPNELWILAGLVPWLAAELYYARPFFAVDTGLISRSEFLRRYVAFDDDFRALDSLLPAKAELYVKNTRGPSVYFPRRVIYSLSDHRPDLALYEFSVDGRPPADSSSGQSRMQCGAVMYHNPASVIEAYRTPGARPLIGSLSVRPCTMTDSRTLKRPENAPSAASLPAHTP